MEGENDIQRSLSHPDPFTMMHPNKLLEPTPVVRFGSAFAVDIIGPGVAQFLSSGGTP
jgi:hypothetical protein